MLTRQGAGAWTNPDEVDTVNIDEELAAAGADPNLSNEEKKVFYNTLIESKVSKVEMETKRLSLNTLSDPSQGSSETTPRQSLATPSSREHRNSASSPAWREPREQSDESGKRDVRHTLPGGKPFPNDEAAVKERRPGPAPAAAKKGPAVKGGGRGRAVPTKATKYPPLYNPGQDHTSSHPISPGLKNEPMSPTPAAWSNDHQEDSPPSPQRGFSDQGAPSPSARTPRDDSPIFPTRSPDAGAVKQEGEDSDGIEAVGNEVDLPDVSVKSEQRPSSSDMFETEADSPSSVQDVDVEGEEEDDRNKEPTKTVPLGNLNVLVSPFEGLVKPMCCRSFSYFEELDEFRDNKAEWMARAKMMIYQHRQAVFARMNKETLQWGPPVQDGGYNKQTLFKQVTPTYSSKLFAGPSDRPVTANASGPASGRSERHSKVQAKAKIQESLAGSPPEHGFHALRKSKRQVEREDVMQDDDDVQCLEEGVFGTPEGEVGMEQRRRHPGVLEMSPLDGGSRDPYVYDDDEDWVEGSSKNKKNNKRGGKLPQDSSIDSRPSQRGRGVGPQNSRGRNTRLRLQKGQLAHPSEHAGAQNNSRNRRAHVEHEEIAQGSASGDIRAGMNTTRSETENAGDIPAGRFYNSKVAQPRGARIQENQRSNEFLPSASTSGRQSVESSPTPLIPCPICGVEYPQKEIEQHAGSCVEYGGNGVGEEPASTQDSEDSVKAVEDSADDEGNQPRGGNNVDVKCGQCNEHFSVEEIKNNQHKCGVSVAAGSGHKRAGSAQVDDEPSWKSSRYSN